MLLYLKGKVAIVTGASRGIGRQTALSVAEAGAKVVLTSRNESSIISLAEEIRNEGGSALPVVTDVTQESQVMEMVEKTLEEYGRIDILVNNAGDPGPTVPVHTLSLDDWHEVIDSSLTGTYLCCRSVVPHMITGGGGRIINMSSVAGKAGLPNRAGYCAAKGGIIGLTRGLALELGPYNICVNAIVPGAVAGERLDFVTEKQAKLQGIDVDELRKVKLNRSPLQRFVEQKDIADLVVFLAGEAGKNITGEDINVTAGAVVG
ncbi:hypothetical protein SY88_15550 [Clostridiales bacterium PH28_bin88]|nr:hypothetical protein SY88_15550 [Clostridiales bacterium PH28_bin88]